MKRLTWLGTLAMPALIITGLYGMNLEWLPLADNPPAVFLILALVTAVSAYVIKDLKREATCPMCCYCPT